jgi:ribosome modulation factor
MKYLKKFNENYYVGAVWTAGNRGTDELNSTITLPYRGYSYDDEDVAYQKGYDAFEKSENKNPYETEQFPNQNLIEAWWNGWRTAEQNSKLSD